MPPNEIYFDEGFYKEENRPGGVLRNFWTYVGHLDQIAHCPEQGPFISAKLGASLPIFVTIDGGQLRGFINLCRHRAATLLERSSLDASGLGCGSFGQSITCKYHGWQYTCDGRLSRAVSMKGVENFSPRANGLIPVAVKTVGPFIFARCRDPASAPSSGKSSTSEAAASHAGDDALSDLASVLGNISASSEKNDVSDTPPTSYKFVGRHTYEIRCNWKVFADNYLDGGYHISRLHPGLASQLDLKTYASVLYPHLSVQTCDALTAASRRLAGNEVPNRVGRPDYCWVFPTTAINKYGPWIDVHVVTPTSPVTCSVMFDYFLSESIHKTLTPNAIATQMHASADVQREDIDICERVQEGLSSSGYTPGRYAGPEKPSHHFHQLLAKYI